MASAVRLPLKSIGFTIALVVGLSASKVNIKELLRKTYTGPGRNSRIVATILVLLNLKNVLGAWHFRVFNAILKHMLFSNPNIPPEVRPGALFLPVITTSHAPLLECDYNFHKSNSTYFSDLDVTRSHLFCTLFQPGIHKLNHASEFGLLENVSGNVRNKSYNCLLGSVICAFKREIGMYEGYEMWSRLLCWDRKWFYIVTHFVKKGKVKPTEYILTDGSWFGGKGYKRVGEPGATTEIDEKFIFASALSKYVGKKGRLTIHPEVLMDAGGMLPPKPGGWHTNTSGDSTPDASVTDVDEESSDTSVSGEWDWKRVEAENKRGLQYVEHFQALEGLHQEFTGSRGPALGKYRDFLV